MRLFDKREHRRLLTLAKSGMFPLLPVTLTYTGRDVFEHVNRFYVFEDTEHYFCLRTPDTEEMSIFNKECYSIKFLDK